MVRRVYIIPLSGSQEAAQLNSERIRVGNIFDTTRQGVILTRNSEAGEMKTTLHSGIDSFGKLSDTAYERNKISTEGINVSYRAKTAAYTILSTDYVIDCTSGTFTVNLPTASGIAGRVYIIKNSGAGVITIDGNGAETIDGSATKTVAAAVSYTLVSTGTNWIIV